MRPAEQEKIETQNRFPFADYCRTTGLIVGTVAFCSTAWAETRITPSASVDATFTDNVRSSTEGTEESDLFTRPTVGFRMQNTGGRTSLNLSYNLSADRYLDATDLNEERHSLTGLGNVEIVRGQFDVDVQSSLSRLTVDRGGATSAVDRNLGSNQTDTLTYGITPRYRTNISNWALSDAQYGFSQTVFDPFGNLPSDQDTAQDSTNHQVSYTLGSGRRFARFGWSGSANYSRSSQGDSTTNSMSGDVTTRYRINRFFEPRVSAGYDKFKGGNNNTSGMSWAVGAAVTPGPRTSINVEYGRDFDDDHIQGDARFQITPTITLTATAVHQFAVTQTQISNGLQNLAVDENGNFIDATTGLPFTGSPTGGDLSEVNNVTRTQTYSLALSGSRGRNTYGMQTSVRDETNNLSGRKTTTMSSSANYRRSLSPYTTASLSASVSGTDDNTSDDVTTASISASLSYRLGDNISGSTAYTHSQTDSSGAGGDRMENTITARLQISF